MKQTWEEFNRKIVTNPDGFYGCVAPDGTWFDSADDFAVAVHWCCYHAGEFNLHTEAGEMEWMASEGRRLGYSIIHSTMLKQMYEKELIK